MAVKEREFKPQKHKIKFTKENFEGLAQLYIAAQQVTDVGYEASKSNLENIAGNLKLLNHTCYMYRNTKFRYPLAREWDCSTCADTGRVELAPTEFRSSPQFIACPACEDRKKSKEPHAFAPP